MPPGALQDAENLLEHNDLFWGHLLRTPHNNDVFKQDNQLI